MNKLVGILALAVAGTACQHQTPPTQAGAALPLATTAAPAPAPNAPPAVAPLPQTPQLLRQYSLVSLLETAADSLPTSGAHIFNGFFGAAHQRIEVVFTSVQPVARQPGQYRVRGKNRYKGIITPFAGTLVFDQVVAQPRLTAQELADGHGQLENQPAMYTTVGHFVLREDSTRRNAGVFRGQAAIDWHVNAAGELKKESQTGNTLTHNGGIKFEGTWAAYGTHQQKPVVWVEDIFEYGPQVFNDFAIGERDIDFNPKYAKLGWNTYWTNDEWWGDSTKTVPNANLPRTILFTPPVVRADDSATTAE